MATNDFEACQMVYDNSQTVLQTMHKLFLDKINCDVFLTVGNKDHATHRLVLCAFSDVFQAMLMKPQWSEWNETRVVLHELPQCEPVFSNFLEYFYTGKIMITHVNVMGILCLADKYIVKGLSRLCTQYMSQHISHAATYRVLFSWLHYTINSNHKEVATKCINYIKWNLERVANTPEFNDFDAELFVNLLQQNDVVVYNEMVLFNFVSRWLDLQEIALVQSGVPKAELQLHMKNLVEVVMNYIRFPMMTPRELADLLPSPLIKKYKEFFVERMAIGMIFHSGQKEHLKNICATDEGKSLLTPRLYTCDNFSAVMQVENVSLMPNYHTYTFVFSSHMSAADYESESVHNWVVDLYPKGVWFKKCFLIVWQGILEVPEQILNTVRLSLAYQGPADTLSSRRVRVALLIYGNEGGVESICKVVERNHEFTGQERLLNIDDFLPFEDFNLSGKGLKLKSPYLTGPNLDQIKLNIVITPRCPDFNNT